MSEALSWADSQKTGPIVPIWNISYYLISKDRPEIEFFNTELVYFFSQKNFPQLINQSQNVTADAAHIELIYK